MGLRILLDENVPSALSLVLRALGHEAVHITDERLAGIKDPQLVEFAKDFDLMMTLDLHRQRSNG